MINKEALNKAKAIPEEDRESEALKNIKQSTKNLEDSQEKFKQEMEQVDNCFNMLINQAAPKDKAKAVQTVSKVNDLLAKLKQGGDVNDIVKQIKNLSI